MRLRTVLALAAAIPAAIMLTPGVASAHTPGIEGYQDCDGSVVYRSVAWVPPDGNTHLRINPTVEIRIWADDPASAADNLSEAQIAALTPVHVGAYSPENNFQFGGVWDGLGKPANLRIRATAAVKWGGGQDQDVAGNEVEGTIAPKADCPAPTTTTVAPTTTTLAPTPTTRAPAPPAGKLPFTGTSTTVPLLVGGLTLVLVGTAAVWFGRRHEAARSRG
jgi:LPXTG-motif cell wall-anchored protein